ncbi:MAG: ATP-binding cassette domain-containing protein [Candidatus Aenigmarchaeota archaeon]|nr:ATP-binding cassette domain-containing protein [Candidatus Aenigmarchaeota archaeon]
MLAIEMKGVGKQYEQNIVEPGIAGAVKWYLHRKIKTVQALKGFSLSVKEGEMMGVIGPNGAGKSTAIKIMTGILRSDSGSVRVLGKDPFEQRQDLAKDIGVVFGQRTQLWWDLPPRDTFDLLHAIYNIPDKTFSKNLEMFTEILDLGPLLGKPVRKLSLGERMRCEIAAALLHNPKLVFLDEPTIGLDLIAKENVRDFLIKINRENKTTIILTTHDMGDIEELCDRVAIVDIGKKVYDGKLEKIRKLFGKEKEVSVEFHSQPSAQELRKLGMKIVKREGERYWFSVHGNISSAVKKLVNRFNLHDIEIEEPEIEEIIKKVYREGVRNAKY